MMGEGERESTVNSGCKKSDVPRWESERWISDQLCLSVMFIFTSRGTRSYQKGGAGCKVMARIRVVSGVENMALPDPRIVYRTNTILCLMLLLYITYVWQ